MISEKTVELNLTADLLGLLRDVYGGHFYAIGFTQREESTLALDAALRSTGAPLLVQYKRAHETARGLRWNLNRTRTRDQHKRLQFLESAGLVVMYALPCYSREVELQVPSPTLLARTAFVPPLALALPGGPIGHHHIERDAVTGKWSVHSADGEAIPSPLSVQELVIRLSENIGTQRDSIEQWRGRFEDEAGLERSSVRPLVNWHSGVSLIMPEAHETRP